MYYLSNLLSLKEEQFDCVFCLSIFKHFDQFLGESFINDFLLYLKRRVTFKGLLILDLSYWKIKSSSRVSPDKIREILVE